MLNDTIAAISTPLGEGGIAVIRVSGDAAVSSVDGIFKSKQKLSDAPTHTVQYGHIADPQAGTRLEEVLVTVMRAPRSFTREDVVEISCHGGLVSVKKVLDLLLMQEVRLAEPGEFTKRAYLNGRIDLTQAEAVMDLIRAKSDRAFQIAMRQAEGSLSVKVKNLRYSLVELMAHIEVNIDYPEHDVEELTNTYIREKCSVAMAEVDRLLRSARQGKILREGIVTAIVGRPNVGKSSLLNALAQENRAIVTDIPGTTRDVIEEYVTVGGIPLKLLDTAGVRETEDVVERLGVDRSRKAMASADLILLVLNYNEALTPDDLQLIELVPLNRTIVLVNKVDLPGELDLNEVKSRVKQSAIVSLSVAEGSGLDDLEKAIVDLFFEGEVETDDLTYVSNVRHMNLLGKAQAALQEAYDAAEALMPIDMIQIDIRTAWEHLGEMIGDAVSESLIDQIFSQFCLGK